jgi:hypothetical protein
MEITKTRYSEKNVRSLQIRYTEFWVYLLYTLYTYLNITFVLRKLFLNPPEQPVHLHLLNFHNCLKGIQTLIDLNSTSGLVNCIAFRLKSAYFFKPVFRDRASPDRSPVFVLRTNLFGSLFFNR